MAADLSYAEPNDRVAGGASTSLNSAIRSVDCGHLEEIAGILAVGLMRLMARKSSANSGISGDSSLDFSPDQSGHALDSMTDDSIDG